jgi:xanthine dehydrogenase/oxidase
LVTSTRAHANIVKIDTSEALAVPGVVDFVCHTDIPGNQEFGVTLPDSTVFATDKVSNRSCRFVR